MARYEISHDLDKKWICEKDNAFYWGDRKDVYRFSNYKKALEAVLSLPDEKRMYGVSYRTRIHYMKFHDSEEHRKSEARYLEAKRFHNST